MEFVGATYDGQRTADEHRFNGLGQYTFANGDVYIGGMRDGAFDGHGSLFFRSTRAREATKAAQTTTCAGGAQSEDGPSLKQFLAGATATSTTTTTTPSSGHEGDEEAWSGHYRGFWKNGVHVWGGYVFADGLVYGSQQGSANQAASTTAPTAALDRTSTTFWAYCQSDDHRLWSEHLRHLLPVFPFETVLGGAKVNTAAITARSAEAVEGSVEASPSKLWVDMPMLVPSCRLSTLTPPSLANGQPRTGAAIPAGWWQIPGDTTRPSTANKTEDGQPVEASGPTAQAPMSLPAVMALPTPPLQPEQDPDQVMLADGTVEGRARRVEEPALSSRFARVDTLLQTGGRVLESRPTTAAQQEALKVWMNQPVSARGARDSAERAKVTGATSMAAVAACRPAATAASSLPRMTATKACGKPISPRPPAQRPVRDSGSAGRAHLKSRQNQITPAVSSAEAAPDCAHLETTEPITDERAPSPGLPQLLVTMVPKVSAASPSSDDDEGGDAVMESRASGSHTCAPQQGTDTHAAAPELPSGDVPLIVLNTVPRISQLSHDDEDDEESGDGVDIPIDDDVEATKGTGGYDARQVQAATTLQSFARMAHARAVQRAHREAIDAHRAAEADGEDDEGDDDEGWMEEAEYDETEM